MKGEGDNTKWGTKVAYRVRRRLAAPFGRRKKRAADPEPTDEPAPHGAVGWSAGSHWAATAVRTAVWVALVCGPAALVGVLANSTSADPVMAVGPSGNDRGEQAAVSEYAGRFVTTWIETKESNADRLQEYVDTADSVTWSQKPAGAAGTPTVSGLEQQPNGLWSVTVSVYVTPTGADSGERRYFQTAINYDDGALVAMAMPTPVAAPSTAEASDLIYDEDVAVDSSAGETIGDFLNAALAGGGDLSRYVSPGASLRAVSPAPYEGVEVTAIASDTAVDGDLSRHDDGDEAHVLVTAAAKVTGEVTTPVQYALTLRSRDGRWEIAEIQPAPLLDPEELHTRSSGQPNS